MNRYQLTIENKLGQAKNIKALSKNINYRSADLKIVTTYRRFLKEVFLFKAHLTLFYRIFTINI